LQTCDEGNMIAYVRDIGLGLLSILVSMG
jgi:hypothetical protein